MNAAGQATPPVTGAGVIVAAIESQPEGESPARVVVARGVLK